VTVEEWSTGGNPTRTTYYLDPELARQPTFGVVEVTLDDGFVASAPELSIAFTAKTETLKYYVVARNYAASEAAQLAVQDGGFVEESRPEVKFTKVAAGAFGTTDVPPALLGPGTVTLFKSQGPVARRAAGRKKIQLKRNNDVLVEHLPQPRADRATADLIVHVAKP